MSDNTVAANGATLLAEDGENYLVSLSGAGNSNLSGGKGSDNITNNASKVKINGDEEADFITNNGFDVTVNGGKGNDSIVNDSLSFTIDDGKVTISGYKAKLNGDDGDDFIRNTVGEAQITTEDGYLKHKDSIAAVEIYGGAGNDSIENEGSKVSVFGGAGNDSIYNNGKYSSNTTITGGAGNDLISLGSATKNNVIVYTSGGGNDIIYGFRADSTLSIGGGSYSTTKSGNDIIVTADDGQISLVGAASLSAVNITGTKTVTETNTWKLNGTTATYGTTSKTLVTVKGVNSTEGLSIKGKVVTVAKSALNNSNVTVSNGYTLALASDVDKTATTAKAWGYSNSAATYSQTTSAYYVLAGNKKSITYKKATSKTLFTVSGVKSASGLSVSGNVITVEKSALNGKTVTISGDYTLKLADDVPTPKATSAGWTYKNNVATYKAASIDAGYSLASNGKSITYSAAKAASTLATINGVTSKSGLKVSGKVITVPNNIISSSKKVTVNGNDYEFKLAAGNTAITGSGNADKITNSGANVSITGGKGNDFISLASNAKNNVIVYSNGDGNDTVNGLTADDTIKIASGTAVTSTDGNDVIFTVSKGKITIKDAKNKTFSYSDADGNKTYPAKPAPTPVTTPGSTDTYIINDAGTAVTLLSSYSEGIFNVNDDIDGGNKIATINASAVTQKIRIKGNSLANKIIGSNAGGTLDGGKGKVSDTLKGGNGSDVFIYYKDDGNDVISGYSANDIIRIEEGVVDTIRSSLEDVIFSVGDGEITVQDVKGTRITYIEDEIEYGYLNGIKTLNITKKPNDTIATLYKSYWKDNFDATKLGNEDVGKSITQINAYAVTRTLKITGNDRANLILGSKTKSNTIIGGGSDDTLQGGDGADVFIYTAGDGDDSIIGYDVSDKISITSGTVDNVTVNSKNDIVLTVGTGKIILENAAGKKITYYDENHPKGNSQIYGSEQTNVAESWFLADDNNYYGLTLDLSSIVQSKSADCSFVNTSTKLTEENNLIAYSGKKITR